MANIPAPFTENQVDYFRRSLTSWFNVAEGGKRGGKNVLQVLAFCTALQTHPNRLHLIAGVSQANARLNIVDCDGYGIANFFEGHYREGKYKDKPAIYVQTPAGEKIILISGGGKDGDEKYIKGNTYGMAYVTEANECHPRFIAEVFDRTLSSANRKVFHDLNPKDENHWYYTDILGHHEQMQAKLSDYGYNYGHFTIADNLSIPDDKLRTILRSYKKGTVWYRRDIRGERCAAEGLVYPQFVDNEDDYYITVDEVPRDTRPIYVGQDFGGNKSKHTYCASAVSRDGRTLYVLASDEDKATGTKVNFIVNSLGSFISRVEGIYGRRVDRVYADSMEQAIVNTEKGVYGASFIHNSIKNEVIDRIRCEDLLLSTKRIKIVKEHNKSLIAALRSATWDPKADKDDRLDIPGVTNICPLDALEYSFEAHIRDLTRRL
jgi:PBSX family phage terminase large subunit